MMCLVPGGSGSWALPGSFAPFVSALSPSRVWGHWGESACAREPAGNGPGVGMAFHEQH